MFRPSLPFLVNAQHGAGIICFTTSVPDVRTFVVTHLKHSRRPTASLNHALARAPYRISRHHGTCKKSLYHSHTRKMLIFIYQCC
jgi:hypothetical protein